jgi:hypothetical protein
LLICRKVSESSWLTAQFLSHMRQTFVSFFMRNPVRRPPFEGKSKSALSIFFPASYIDVATDLR